MKKVKSILGTVALAVAIGFVAACSGTGGSSSNLVNTVTFEKADTASLSLPSLVKNPVAYKIPSTLLPSFTGPVSDAVYTAYPVEDASVAADTTGTVTPSSPNKYIVLDRVNSSGSVYQVVDSGAQSVSSAFLTVGDKHILVHIEAVAQDASKCLDPEDDCYSYAVFSQELPNGSVNKISDGGGKNIPSQALPSLKANKDYVFWQEVEVTGAEIPKDTKVRTVAWTPTGGVKEMSATVTYGTLSVTESELWVGSFYDGTLSKITLSDNKSQTWTLDPNASYINVSKNSQVFYAIVPVSEEVNNTTKVMTAAGSNPVVPKAVGDFVGLATMEILNSENLFIINDENNFIVPVANINGKQILPVLPSWSVQVGWDNFSTMVGSEEAPVLLVGTA